MLKGKQFTAYRMMSLFVKFLPTMMQIRRPQQWVLSIKSSLWLLQVRWFWLLSFSLWFSSTAEKWKCSCSLTSTGTHLIAWTTPTQVNYTMRLCLTIAMTTVGCQTLYGTDLKITTPPTHCVSMTATSKWVKQYKKIFSRASTKASEWSWCYPITS